MDRKKPLADATQPPFQRVYKLIIIFSSWKQVINCNGLGATWQISFHIDPSLDELQLNRKVVKYKHKVTRIFLYRR